MTEVKNNKGGDFINIVMSIYVVLIGAGVPLVFHNKYFDILITKYFYYCACTIVMVIILIFNCVLNIDKIDRSLLKSKIKGMYKNLTLADYSVILFYAVAFVSTISSNYVYESFWGNEGRFTGLFLTTWYVISYFCINRFWRFNIKFIDIIIFSGVLVCAFGITDYFNLDILNFKGAMIDSQRNIFTSTIGNINTYTAYVGIIAAISSVLFTTERKMKKMIFYFFCMVISFFAIIMGTSDNAYLSLGSLFAFLPLYLFKDNNGIKKYIIVLTTFLTVIQVIGWINNNFGDQVSVLLDSSFKLLIGIKELSFLSIILWLVVLIWFMIEHLKNTEVIYYGNSLIYFWLAFLAIIFLGVLYVLYDCNFNGNYEKYGSLSAYFLFNDEWGTHRGYIWRNAMECYLDMSWWKKIVGYGPETFGILMLQKTANNPYKEIFDNAHNEYLHLLTTVGFMGLISYISFVIGVIVSGIKYHINKPHIVAVLFGVVCYSVQAFVNLNLPIATPIFWVLLAIGSTRCLNKEC